MEIRYYCSIFSRRSHKRRTARFTRLVPPICRHPRWVIVALYKDGRFVGYESAVYNGEALEITAAIPHDTAAVMAWKAFDKLIPLAPVAKI